MVMINVKFSSLCRLFPVIFLLFLTGCFLSPERKWGKIQYEYKESIFSPDNKIKINVLLEDGDIYYELFYYDNRILHKSLLGLYFKQDIFSEGLVLVEQTKNHKDTVWHPIYGITSSISDHHNELLLELADRLDNSRRLNIRFRAFNDGIGFRYEMPAHAVPNQYTITGEKTSWSFPENYTAWAVPEDVEYHNPGPVPVSQLSGVKFPVTMDAGPRGWLSINEAALYEYSTLLFVSSVDSLLKTLEIDEVLVSLPFQSPWRVIQLAETAPKLLESNLFAQSEHSMQHRRPFMDQTW
jgi:hypothetical protein